MLFLMTSNGIVMLCVFYRQTPNSVAIIITHHHSSSSSPTATIIIIHHHSSSLTTHHHHHSEKPDGATGSRGTQRKGSEAVSDAVM